MVTQEAQRSHIICIQTYQMIYLITTFIALSWSAIESVSYLGFFYSHLHVHSFFIYFLSIILSLSYKDKLKAYASRAMVLGYVLGIGYFILIFLESVSYPNFVFTHFHINPLTFQIFVSLAWFHILIINKENFSKSLLIALLIFVAIDGAGRTTGYAYKGIKDMIKDPFATYDQKMSKAYPGFYPAMLAVKSITPNEATILIPPQGNPWEVEGNAAMVTYFLYPRHVINLNVDTISSIPDHTFILIAKGSWPRVGEMDYGWPKVPVSAFNIWEIDTKSGITNSYLRNYNPDTDKWDWGLIEVKNE